MMLRRQQSINLLKVRDTEETIVSNCAKYREKFLKIIEKLGIGECDIKDEEARKRL